MFQGITDAWFYKPYKCNCSCQTSCGDAISDVFNGLPNFLGGKCINQSHIQERESIYIPYDFSCSCQFPAVEVNKKTISNLRMSSSTNLMIAIFHVSMHLVKPSQLLPIAFSFKDTQRQTNQQMLRPSTCQAEVRDKLQGYTRGKRSWRMQFVVCDT